MTQLQILTQFKELFNDVQECLLNYNQNLKNELFEVEPNEDQNNAYKRGETIFDRIQETIMRNDLIERLIRHTQENPSFLLENKKGLLQQTVPFIFIEISLRLFASLSSPRRRRGLRRGDCGSRCSRRAPTRRCRTAVSSCGVSECLRLRSSLC